MKKEIIRFIMSICELKRGKVNSIEVTIKTNDGETFEKLAQVKK